MGVVQHLAHYSNADYGPDVHDGEGRLKYLSDGIDGIRTAGAEIVAQLGRYWSLAPDIRTARALGEELSAEFDVRAILNWTAIVDALLHFGAKQISVTTGYYRPAWTAASIAFLESAGFKILWSGDLVDQEILRDEAAIDLSRPTMSFRRPIMTTLISPLIVLIIISARYVFLLFEDGIDVCHLGIVLAHAAVNTPFVVITVTAALVGFDEDLIRASSGLGANPIHAFIKIILPLVTPGIISVALFAFIASSDEVVLVYFWPRSIKGASLYKWGRGFGNR